MLAIAVKNASRSSPVWLRRSAADASKPLTAIIGRRNVVLINCTNLLCPVTSGLRPFGGLQPKYMK